jgi:hypothetical protein
VLLIPFPLFGNIRHGLTRTLQRFRRLEVRNRLGRSLTALRSRDVLSALTQYLTEVEPGWLLVLTWTLRGNDLPEVVERAKQQRLRYREQVATSLSGEEDMMRSALLAVSVVVLAGALLFSPVSQQSAQAQMLGGLKASAADSGNLVTLVRRGGGGRGGHIARGGGGRAMHAYRGGGRAVHAYRGGGRAVHAYRGEHRRYGYYGGYRRYGYYGGVGYYGGGCGWLHRNAVATGSSYWWNRYYACRGY